MGPKNACEYADFSIDKIDQLVNNPDEPINPSNIRPDFRARIRDYDTHNNQDKYSPSYTNKIKWLKAV